MASMETEQSKDIGALPREHPSHYEYHHNSRGGTSEDLLSTFERFFEKKDAEKRPHKPSDECSAVQEVAAHGGVRRRRQSLFKEYAAHYYDSFRARIDLERQEEPRQLIAMISMMLVILLAGRFSRGRSLHHCARIAVVSGMFAICVYCFLQTRDGLLVRPHPGLWRIVHGVGISWMVILVIFAVVDVDVGMEFFYLLFPQFRDVHREPPEETEALDCHFSSQTIVGQLRQPWFTCHILGWAAQMLVFRDWDFCLITSLGFEMSELSLQWIIPDFKECWWDSLILDVAITNMTGMFVGVLILRWLNSYEYDWYGNRPLYKKLLVRLMPFTWSEYEWQFCKTPKRLIMTILLCLGALLTEINSFFIIFALQFPPGHALLKCRLLLMVLLATPATAEWYHYANSSVGRVGHNAWLFGSILSLELIVTFRYGARRFDSTRSPSGVLVPWALALPSFGFWCLCKFKFINSENKKLRSVAERVSSFSPWWSFVPLLSLTRFYYF